MVKDLSEYNSQYYQRRLKQVKRDPAFRYEYNERRAKNNKKAVENRAKRRKIDPFYDDHLKEVGRNDRYKQYMKNREAEKQKMREHYAKNKEYFRQKNKEYNEKNGEKWKARRREITRIYVLEHARGSEINALLASLGADIVVDKNMRISFEQAYAFVRKLGYTKDEIIENTAFRKKYEYYIQKKLNLKKSPQ